MARKALIWIVFVLIVVNFVIVGVVFLGGSNPPPTPLPNPNGYDDFVKAGQMIPQGYSYDYKTMARDKLASLVATNAAALKLVREGLKLTCRVPEDYSPDSYGTSISNLMQIKGLALNLCAEGRLIVLDGNTNGAVGSYLDAIRFGQESSRDGVMVVKLVGIACETSASEELRALIGGIGANKCREVAQSLETIDATEEPAEENLRQEAKWMRAANSLRERISDLLDFRSVRQIKKGFVVRFYTNALRRRRMEIEFAARAYELEKGKPPQSMADLVPEYLKTVPKNPATGKDLGLGQ
jgi:hypothetical protein